jgi:C4-dicarboxylate-binding protein DctP
MVMGETMSPPKKSRRLFAVSFLSAAAGAALGAFAPAAAQSLELKHGTFLPPRHPSTQTMRSSADMLAAMTDGRVKVKVFDSSTLAKSTDQLDAVQRGVMDLGRYIFTYSSLKQRPFYMVGSIPFLYRDGAGFIQAWTSDPTLMEMANAYAPKYGYDNVILFDVSYSGFARVALRNKEARTPSDLKGLKIRGTGTYIAIVESYGGSAVTIDTPEVYGALERGLIDGAIGLNTNWINFKWAEPATYLIDYNLAPVGATLALSKTTWTKLSDRDKGLFRYYAKYMAAELTNQYLQEDVSGNNILASQVKIYTPTSEEKKLWDAPRGKVVDEWIKVIGDADGRKAIAIIEKYNK